LINRALLLYRSSLAKEHKKKFFIYGRLFVF
jgi:hypothetical protein